MPYSHHSHSGSFCRHAKGTLEEVVEEAIKQQFKVFCLSEHAPRYRQEDLYPEESDLTPSSLSTIFTSYLNEAHRLRSLHSSTISLPIGLETDLITPLDLTSLHSLLNAESSRIDYLVGSLHHVNQIPIDFDQPTFLRAIASFNGETDHARMTELLHSYFDQQWKLIESFEPEVVGHFDLVRLWEPRMDFRTHEGVWEKVERNVKRVVSYGGLFEVNAAAFRKGWEEAYPAWDVLQLILSLNGRLCLSDDSHGPLAVGLNYSRLRDYLRSHSVDEMWYLHLDLDSPPAPPPANSTRPPRSGRVTPRRVEGNWWEGPFWDRLASTTQQ